MKTANFNVNNFQKSLPQGGARPSLFQVEITPPVSTGVQVAEHIKFTTQAATIPAGTIDPIEVNYFGRIFKIPGGRTFEDWTTTVLNREDYSVRGAIEKWMDNINGNVTNVESGRGTTGGSAFSNSWAVDADVVKYDSQGGESRRYTLHNCWPTMLTEITLDWAESTAVETFDITWAYSHWTVIDVDNHSPSISATLDTVSEGLGRASEAVDVVQGAVDLWGTVTS